ncbi:MAG: DUF2914 domain-containing protein [Myxococcota bacterium]|nr:DUF2914 domain-containing protein [Myxococcota bacterium]
MPTACLNVRCLASASPADYTLVTLQGPPHTKLGGSTEPSDPEAPIDFTGPPPMRPSTRLRLFLRDHGRKLVWLHSGYALAIGAGVILFAQKGFEHARWLAVTLGLAWLLVVLVFRLFGSGGEMRAFDARDTKTRVHFYVMTYALKNLYQGMLFFLLPFYWKSTTIGAENAWFVVLLAACAVISTIDIVFDRVLMRWRALASIFHGITLFGCLNLVIPALFPDTRTLGSLLAAAGITVIGFWTLHVTGRVLRKKVYIAIFVLSVGMGIGVAYAARAAIPPVPMYVSSAAVGPKQLADGRLAMEVKALHPSVIQELIAVTDVVVPGGKGDRLHHVWLHEGWEVHRSTEETSRIPGPKGVVRLQSSLTGRDLPADLVGAWSVDVETEDGQLVGRAEFRVVE